MFVLIIKLYYYYYYYFCLLQEGIARKQANTLTRENEIYLREFVLWFRS